MNQLYNQLKINREKKLSLLTLLFGFFFFANNNSLTAQIIPIAGDTACYVAGNGGIFADPGGLTANYPNCACETVTTLCSPDGSAITIDFTFFDVFATFDYVEIYAGDTPTGTPLFNNGTGGANAGDITLVDMMASAGTTSFTSTSGCITMLFFATGVVDYEGWSADVTVGTGSAHPGDNLPCGTNIACLTPAGISTDQVYGTSADISWIDSDSAGIYVLEYGPPGFLPGTGTTISTIDPATTITGLMENTTYEYFVLKNCASGDTSGIAGPISFTTIALNDVGIIDISSPLSGCGLGEETITVTMENFGSHPQSLIPFFYSVNGTPVPINIPLDGYYTDVIGKDSMVTLDFNALYDFSQPGTYEIAAWTELDPDSDISNDTFYYTITSIPTIPDFPYAQNFEDNDGGWAIDATSTNSSWAFGEPVGTNIPSAASGTNAWVTNLSGNYNNSEISYVVSNCFDFSTLTQDPVITLSVNYDTETSFDGGWLESTIDGGATWTKIGGIGTGINWYTVENTFTGLGDVWAGNSGGWIFAKHDLVGMAGEPNVRFRFGFGSDGSVNGFDGIGIDDIGISVPVANDLAAQNVTNATTLECGDPADQLTITIVNNGTAAQTGFDVGYQIGTEPPVIENVGALINIAPNESADFTFSAPFNSTNGGTYEIIAWTDLAGELNVTNDTTTYSFSIFADLPLAEDFEGGNAVPTGWTTDGIVGTGHNTPSNAVYRNLWSSNPSMELVTLPIGPIAAGDMMTFDYRYTDWSAGTVGTDLGADNFLEVQVSTDCGMTYTTLMTIDQSNHVISNEMATMTVDISSLAGENVKFRWQGTWGSGDYWLDIDNINIWQCGSLDLVASSTIESDQGFLDGTATVIANASLGPYTYLWSNDSTTATITELEGGIYTVTVTDVFGCSDQIEVTVDVGVNTNELETLKKIILAPNPTSNIATLDMEFSKNVNIEVQVINTIGQILYSTFKENTTAERVELDLVDYPSGMYFVRITVDNETITKKLMKNTN